ncbi:MAG: hypothetical protein ABFD46_07005 [Armatimonadota bacterium]
MRSGFMLMMVITAVLLLVTSLPTPAIDIGDALTAFGIGYAVRVYGNQINSGLNTLMAQRGVEWEGTTKVVPILSIGTGSYIGAAQVAGPPSLVNTVKAVAQGETRIGNSLRAKLFIPVSSTNVLKGVKRVEGVGLSALIDFKL